MKDSKDKNPEDQILLNNPWYVENQFQIQLQDEGKKSVVENRLKIFNEVIGEYIQVTKSQITLLDAGCGDGINLYGLVQIASKNKWDIEITGLDYNPLRVERAGKLTGIKEVIQGNLLQLPFKNGSFDIILCNHVIEHIPEYQLALQELVRVVKPGGRLILAVPNEGCFLAWLRNHVFQPSIAESTDHVNFFTGVTFSQALMLAGIHLINLRREGFFIPHLSIHSFIMERKLGREFFDIMKRLFPSQAAGLIAICTKGDSCGLA